MATKVSVEDVAKIVTGDKQEDVAVVDVRGEDFADGHIKGALQWESERFADDAQVDQLIQDHLLGKSQVVVHCAKSQIRGPRCANRILERLQQLAADKGVAPEVLVMEGGFDRFSEVFAGQEELISKEDK